MTTVIRYTLKKTDRLKSAKDIELLFKKGNSFSLFPLRVCWLNAPSNQGLKAGFTTSSKIFSHATDRNKIKRLLRESYRLQKNELQQITISKEIGLHIFFIYIGKELPKFEQIHNKITKAIQRIISLIDEKTQ